MANKKKKTTSYNYNNQPQAPSLIESLKTPMEYIMRVFVLAIFVGIPLTFTDNATLVMAKQRTFFLMVILLGITILFTVAFLLSQGNRIKINIKAIFKGIRPHEYALFAYWVVMLLSAALSPFGKMGWTGGSTRPQNFLTQSCYILVFFLVSRFYKPSTKDLLIFCGVAALTGAYGICQYYRFDFLGIAVEGQWGIQLQLISTMSNRNVASTYWTIAFCIAYVCFVRKEKWHWLFLALALILFYALLLGDTESGYMGILLAGLLGFSLVISDKNCAARFFLLLSGCFSSMWVHNIACSYLYTNTPENRLALVKLAPNIGGMHGILLPVAAISMLIAMMLYFIERNRVVRLSGWVWHIVCFLLLIAIVAGALRSMPMIAERTGNRSLHQLDEILRGNIDEGFMSGRIFTWRNSIQLVSKHPLIGYGPDCYVEAYNREFYEVSMEKQGVWYDKPHNEYIQVLVDTGLVGFISLSGFFALLYWSGHKRRNETLPLSLGIAVLCFLVQAFFNFATPISHAIVWTMFGVFGAALYMQPVDGELQKKTA